MTLAEMLEESCASSVNPSFAVRKTVWSKRGDRITRRVVELRPDTTPRTRIERCVEPAEETRDAD